MRYFIALDIGGTDIKYGIVNEIGTVVIRKKRKTDILNGIELLIENIKQIVRELLDCNDVISGIGISTAGVVDTEKGEIIHAGDTMPGYAGTNLKIILQDEFGLPVKINNDVNAAALGEGWVGAAKETDTYFCMTLGTGIGGAIVIDKQLYKGKNFKAAEIGYMGKIKGSHFIYEKKAATNVLVQAARILLKRDDLEGNVIFDRAKMQDDECLFLIDKWTEEIAKGLADIICLLDPGLLIIGGGVSKQGDFLTDKIKEKLPLFLPKTFLENTEIKTAQCGNDAGMIGSISEFVE
jgi:predicted NBD/HSP70 family sugar kinase